MADAAQVLRVTAAACHANLLGEQERVDTLLSQLTPNMCSELAHRLELAATATEEAGPALELSGDVT